MTRWLLILLTVLVVTPATAAKPPKEVRPVQVKVSRSGDRFIAEFKLPRAARAWAFHRSALDANDQQPWRPRSWRVLSGGVRLERHGHYDAFVATGAAVPSSVKVEITPYTNDLAADYVPALRLGQGVAMFDGHFAVFSVADPAILDRLPLDLDGQPVGPAVTLVRFTGPKDRLRIAGDVTGYERGASEGAYGLYDIPVASLSNGVATIISPDLPRWIADDIVAYTPRVMASLTARIGPASLAQPTILATWAGAQGPGASMNGGSLRGLLLMRFSGARATSPLPALRDMAHWFIAHEASHFWLGQTVRYDGPADSWIMEGGADLLAIRTVSELDRGFDANKQINAEIAECATLLRRPVGSAPERGEHRATYACGLVFALVAERSSGGDFAAFARRLIDATRDDWTINSTEWLTILERNGGGPQVSRAISILLSQGSRDPAGDLDRLMTAARIPHRRAADGVPQL